MKVVYGLMFGLLLVSVAHAETDAKPIGLTKAPADSVLDTPDKKDVKPQQPTVKIYKYKDKNGVISFSDRAPMRTKYQVVTYSCYACNPRSKVDWYNTPLYMQAFEYPINSAAKKYGVDPALVRAVIHAESAFKPDARSHKGAQGLMQLMPETAKDMGVRDVTSPTQNIQGGVRYLAWLLEQHSGNTLLATAAYNAGPGAVKRYKGVPPYAETETYVKRVKILHERYRKQLTTPEPELASAGRVL